MEALGITDEGNTAPAVTKKWNLGLIIAGAIGGSAVVLSAICLPFVTPALRKICLPYVPATTTQVSNIFKVLEGRQGSLVDLGSGDGRIVIEGAKRGYTSVGVELNPWLVMYSKYSAFKQGLSSSASFYRMNIWKTSLYPYNNVVIFGVDTMMAQLESKCKSELTDGSVIVACRFAFPTLEPVTVLGEGIDTVWLYEIHR